MQEKQPAEREYTIHNCHVHLFNIDHIPKYFLNRLITTSFAKRVARNERLTRTLLNLFPRRFARYSAFFYSALNRPRGIFEELRAYYPGDTKFVPLSVDFDFMEAGRPLSDFKAQLKDLAALKEEFPEKVYPFICADPRRKEELLGLVQEYIEEHKFQGIKLYPALGYFPDDEYLAPVFAYAQENQIPITSHCIPKNPNHYRGRIPTEHKEKARKFVPGFQLKETKRKYDFAMYYNHPFWWEKVLEKFPNLKINLAHFGGNAEWDRYLDDPFSKERENKSWYYMIRKMIENEDYPNVYGDISFTVFDSKLYPLLKSLLKRNETRNNILFGSDFYMLQKDYRERRFGFDVRGYLDDEDYFQIAYFNPKQFLSNKIHGDF